MQHIINIQELMVWKVWSIIVFINNGLHDLDINNYGMKEFKVL